MGKRGYERPNPVIGERLKAQCRLEGLELVEYHRVTVDELSKAYAMLRLMKTRLIASGESTDAMQDPTTGMRIMVRTLGVNE